MNPHLLLAAYSAMFARCGVYGSPISDLAGEKMPACPHCWKATEKAS